MNALSNAENIITIKNKINMNVKGKLYVKGETQKVSEKFSKREFVIETADKYPQKVLIQLTQDKCGLLDLWSVGEQMDVDINLRGREWIAPDGKVKYFNTVEAWRLNSTKNERDGIEQNFVEDKLQAEQNAIDDDLPF